MVCLWKCQAHHCYCIYPLTAKGISQNVFGVYETFMPKTLSFSKLLLCIGHKNIHFLENKMTLKKQWMTLVYQIITTWCSIQNIKIEIAVPLYNKSSWLTTFYVPKIKIRGWVNLYKFLYNENFGKFTRFCQNTFLNSFYILAKTST